MKIDKNIALAKAYLEAGDLVAIPTETVYGLAANALNSAAVVKIFEAKNRPFFNPLIVHIGASEKMDALISSKPTYVAALCEKFWPGPLSLVLPKSDIVPDIVSGGLDTVAIRMPNHPMTLKLLQVLDFPLAAPSANPFKYISPTSAQHVAGQMGDKLAYILDGGPSEVGLESTIIKCLENEIILLREGKIQADELEKCAGVKVLAFKGEGEKPQAPGMLSTHYAPSCKVIVGDIEALLEEYKEKKVGLLSFSKKRSAKNIKQQEILSSTADLAEAASNLFAALRKLDSSEIELILAEAVPNTGIGKAINDRLNRASK